MANWHHQDTECTDSGTASTRGIRVSRDRQTGRDIQHREEGTKVERRTRQVSNKKLWSFRLLRFGYVLFSDLLRSLKRQGPLCVAKLWNRYVHIDEVAEGGNEYCGSEVTRVLTVDKKDDDAEYWIYKFVNIMTLTFGFGFPFTYTYTCVFCSAWVNT